MLFDLSVLLANTQASVGSYAKLTTYECGFLPFGDARQKYNLNFYLAGILFIVFDLELTLLLPGAVIAKECAGDLVWIVYLVCVILALGFLLEGTKGAFDGELLYHGAEIPLGRTYQSSRAKLE